MEKNMFGFSLTERTIEIRPPMTTSFNDVSMVHGREAVKEELLNRLLNESSQEPAISIVSIVGMGGIGKTTLARLVFNIDKVKTHFDNKIWVCVSEPFDEIRISKAILESLGDDASKLAGLETILQHISQYLDRKKFFLVLDDVWTEDSKNWEQIKDCLKCGSQGSRNLVTTRKENASKTIGATSMIMLGTLSKNESWSLFRQIAFSGDADEKLEDIGRKIVAKCKGLPLSIKTLGSLLRFKTNSGEWQSVLHSEMWEIEEVERRIFPPLLVSYYDLPSTLKKCFSYCAIFPKNHEIEKDELIKLWMAQSYLKDERNKDMELIGEEYFENLAMRSFFQDFKKNKYDGSIESCKMHDMVHDFAQFLTKKECFIVEVDNYNESQLKSSLKNAQQSMIIVRAERDSFPTCICNENKLRSLLVKSQDPRSQLTQAKLFDNSSLRALQFISLRNIQEIPREIKKMIHLRYLDLSYNENLKELPKELCDLYNLQTLNIADCYKLTKLPQEMGKLINLRHLIINPFIIEYMPKGNEELTCLRTLENFVLSSSSHGGKACSIGSLKNLTNLRCLGFSGLGNVGDVDEVKRANLRNKTNLLSLILDFGNGSSERDEIIVEALEPPPNLVKLCLENYGGKTIWPNWIVSLTQLKELRLFRCYNCEYLSPLGKLSSLESLFIGMVYSVKKVEKEFLGIESDATARSSIVFPKLKNLEFNYMYEWKEWDDITLKGDELVTTIMPSLHYLNISYAPYLKKLPNYILQSPKLKQLEIEHCPILRPRYEKGIGEDWHKISHIPDVTFFS
ncbi:putative disease resistance protein RGA3 [Pistacia vera]|uniref:putative disease resistance protein RGA3 n=1 Tax=Pistacia vera TaxID=55513 RepID=UPI0012638262|nr:putative disease resistance protein RGA3 [Pistacia vera]XP_031273956.1 putative disease resistance protein RGA3 [Pistacia vera]XP_031273957.1 putative disease resistance protein RGA3 [Pistacia vera]XP_031273958.1 putative disease resistance protein RGA3 [Pistacia vera]XP_031273959.1 putative disease resistance protein RGA3 [Pistacia vera]XP_031273960.1 putative disease resistance protein RGA3 [Pistacia vera]XP_031273961.1 putative disease resistance protein RGA3 [Pistacia vera]XP_03127396